MRYLLLVIGFILTFFTCILISNDGDASGATLLIFAVGILLLGIGAIMAMRAGTRAKRGG